MTVQYACVFGISSGLPSIESGDIINAFLNGTALALIQGKDNRTFWFLTTKLDQKYTYPAVPRFSTNDAAKLCEQMKDLHFNKGLTVGDLWLKRERVSMTALEEGLFKTWFHDRMVLLGDSVHKVRFL